MIFATVLMSSYVWCSKLHGIDTHDRIENCIGLAIPTLCRDDAISNIEHYRKISEGPKNVPWIANDMPRVCSCFIWRSLAIFLFGIIKYSPIDQRTESSVLFSVNFISALRYLRLDYYKRLNIACIGKPGSGLYRILKQRTSAWNACINKNMNICIHHYPILLFYAVFSLSLFDFIVILRPLRFRSIYHNSFLTSLYVSYFRVCSLCSLNNVASVPPSYNLFFSLITLIWLLSSIYEKISVAYLIQFSLFVPALFNHSCFRWEFHNERRPLYC